MRTPKGLHTIAFFLMGASIGAATIVMTPLHAQSRTVLALAEATSAVDPRMLALQGQVASLQAQLNALATAVSVTPAGLVLRGPTVSILAGTISMQAQGTTGEITMQSPQGGLYVRVNSLRLESGTDVLLRAGTAASLQASTTMDIQGSSVRMNGGTKPVAVLGSTVINNQIVTGSQYVFAN